jgi:hypothetical protein
VLPVHLGSLGIVSAWIRDFAGAALLIAETESVATATGSTFAPFTELRLRALQGREAEASALIAGAIEALAPASAAAAAGATRARGTGPRRRPTSLYSDRCPLQEKNPIRKGIIDVQASNRD